jgi:NTE family protein
MTLKNIIFSGGGLKGWAYIGTLKVLSEFINFSEIEQIIGVSIGSVFGLFYLLQIKWDYLLDYVMNLNFLDAIDTDIDSILINNSIMIGDKFIDHIKELVATKINPDVTFIELYRYSRILFTVNALNITDTKLEYFNYLLTPDIKVIDAIRASSALPTIFPPYCINGKQYYDGGICNNCPVNLVNDSESIAFELGPSNCEDSSLLNLLKCMSKLLNNQISDIKHEILDDRFNNEVVNIKQSRDDIFNIYMHGYINSKNIIYNNFFALPWK